MKVLTTDSIRNKYIRVKTNNSLIKLKLDLNMNVKVVKVICRKSMLVISIVMCLIAGRENIPVF